MAKKPGLEVFVRELENDYRRYADLMSNGGSDPFWADGCGLNLIRNHIIYDRRQIVQWCEEKGISLPECMDRPVPEKVDDNFMVGADRIRETA